MTKRVREDDDYATVLENYIQTKNTTLLCKLQTLYDGLDSQQKELYKKKHLFHNVHNIIIMRTGIKWAYEIDRLFRWMRGTEKHVNPVTGELFTNDEFRILKDVFQTRQTYLIKVARESVDGFNYAMPILRHTYSHSMAWLNRNPIPFPKEADPVIVASLFNSYKELLEVMSHVLSYISKSPGFWKCMFKRFETRIPPNPRDYVTNLLKRNANKFYLVVRSKTGNILQPKHQFFPVCMAYFSVSGCLRTHKLSGLPFERILHDVVYLVNGVEVCRATNQQEFINLTTDQYVTFADQIGAEITVDVQQWTEIPTVGFGEIVQPFTGHVLVPRKVFTSDELCFITETDWSESPTPEEADFLKFLEPLKPYAKSHKLLQTSHGRLASMSSRTWNQVMNCLKKELIRKNNWLIRLELISKE
jgi:hypothetical protein